MYRSLTPLLVCLLLITGTVWVSTPTMAQSSTTLTAAPESIPSGGTVVATWANVPGPGKTDWIALVKVGAPEQTSSALIDWKYVSCSRTAGAAGSVAGSCPFVIAGEGDHEFRFYRNGNWTRAATSNPFTVGEQHEGVAMCADHDELQWHPLVQRDAAGTITCTYGHEHHADPNTVNDIFGAPGAWFGSSGQAISYPWQTSSQLGLENHVKHEGYKWYVERDRECKPMTIAAHVGCLRSWRVLVHTLGTAADATSRFHSYSMEAVVEHNGVQGIVRHGGHLDFGHLALQKAGGEQRLCPPLTTNPDTFECGSAPIRIHSGANFPPGENPGQSYFVAWYSAHRTTQLSTTFEEWGPVDYQQPSNQLYFPPERKGNNSIGALGNMRIEIRQAFLGTGGRITFDGYTDQHGVHKPTGCSAPAPTCVPLKVEQAPYATYEWNSGVQGMPYPDDFDVASPVTGKPLVRFPN